MAPILGKLVNRIEYKANIGWKPWALLFFWCLFTHPLLDAFTTWGTQLFWPLDYRIAFNSIFVIAPFYTLPFLIFCIIILFKKKGSSSRHQLNRFSLIFSTFYLITTLVVKFIVNSKFESALAEQHIEYSQISTRPAPFSILLWNANVDTKDSYLIGDYSIFDTKPIAFKAYPKNRSASSDLEGYENVQRLIDISEGWYIIEHKSDQWVFNDLRFGLIPKRNGDSYFAFSYELEKVDEKISATEVEKTRDDAKFILKSLFDRISGN